MQVRALLAFLTPWLPAQIFACVLASCAAPPPPPPPAVPVVEAVPSPPLAPAPVVPQAVSRALVRDSAAVQRHARQYVVRPSTQPEALATLEPLIRKANRALAVTELHHTRSGYRTTDVVAARSAIEAVAAFLRLQPPP